ncbi:MAG: DUF3348 family protein [Spongiibacteraceae bacterium]
MAQPSAYAASQGSRLIHFLREQGVADVDITHRNFADKLGQLIDLSESISLSEALGKLKKTTVTELDNSNNSCVKSQFLDTRKTLIEFIIKSFVTHTGAQPFNLPQLNQQSLQDPAASFELYQRFYSLHQSNMDFRIIKLRGHIRQTLSNYSQSLAQLAALDTALGNTLSSHSRKLFAAIPRLLKKRFLYLCKEQLQTAADAGDSDLSALWTQPGGWLAQYHTEMQGLLLAELEVRLQPVLGLVEAFLAEALDTEETST